jgi:uncharacterized membrane protein YoaK (UPF0700 family)
MLVTELVLQTAATVVAFTAHASAPNVLIAILAVTMGLRNGTVRKIGVPDLTTTVLTTTLASLASESSLAGGSNLRIWRRVIAIVALCGGAAVGAVLQLHFGPGWPLLVSTLLVASVAVGYREPS